MTVTQLIALGLAIFIVGYCSGFNYATKLAARLDEYNKLLRRIDHMIKTYQKDEANYDLIENELINLGRLKHKNKEITGVLSQKFWKEFYYVKLNRQIHES